MGGGGNARLPETRSVDFPRAERYGFSGMECSLDGMSKTCRRGPRSAGPWRLLLLVLVPGCVIPISTASPSADAGADAGDGSVGTTTAGDEGGASVPTGSWSSVAANLAGMPSQCGNMSYVSAKPDEDLLIAGIALDGLWASRDGGGSWQALGPGSDASAPITNRTSSIVYDPQDTTRYWESGIYNAGGVYETTDDGATFIELGDVHHCDLVSIDFTDPNRQTLLAGGHEQSQTLYRSTDGGMTWSPVGGSLPPNTNCTFPLVIDVQTHLVGCGGYGGGATGVYRTTDGGSTWTSTTTLGGTNAPLVASDGSIYWSSAGATGLARSTDQGQTWSSVVASPNVLGSYTPIELPDGRIATIGPSSGTQYVLVSADHGVTWSPASAALPSSYSPVGVAYSSQRKAFFVWHFTCATTQGNDPVPSDAVISFAFDYQTN